MGTRNRYSSWWVCLALLAIFVHITGLLVGNEIERGVSTADPTTEPTTGRLVIEGEAVESLVLEKRSDPRDPLELHHPAPSVAIPPGEYRVKEVHLEGGYRCYPPGRICDGETDEVRDVGWFTVGTDTPYVLRVGAPLKPTLRVIRENRTLRIAYDLLDVSGQELWRYFPADYGREKMASLSVYREGQLIGSDILAPSG